MIDRNLTGINESQEIKDSLYDAFESITCSVVEEFLSKRHPTGLPSWVSRETEDMRGLRDNAKRKMLFLNPLTQNDS